MRPAASRRGRAGTGAPRRRRWDDRGVSILEFAGFLPILLLVGLAAIQLGLVGYAANQAGSGARAAARAASQGDSGEAAGAAAMDSGLSAEVHVGKGDATTTATVEVQVPRLLPFIGTDWRVTKEATMPNDHDDGDTG
ncbi:TadE/TadG family type IV pilus assembly protein [Streptomyces sp. NPDC087300]|uniref:TadE/TadG family type IV pilus assembly protein n=1 Tax=Streptomyces sp. NPDC087300 TaxID=3365780 RepID=UPI003807E584